MEKESGSYAKSFVTDVPADLSSDFARDFSKKIYKYPQEGIYIYSFEEGRMLYADGWEEVTGVPDNEISLLHILNMTAPDFTPFVDDINDKALKFIFARNKQLTDYSFTIEFKLLHQNGTEVPVTAKVSVYETTDSGHLKMIQGRFQVDHGLRFGKVMRYAAYGPEKDEFENELNENLFYPFHISNKELEVLRLLSEGYAYKEMAEKLEITPSAVEKRIRPLFQRFNVRNNAHLIAFAYQNNLLH